MTKADYHAKKGLGLCLYSKGCPEKPKEGTLCEPHKVVRRVINNAANRRDYRKRKLAGLCVRSSCKNPPVENGLLCHPHEEEQKRLAARPKHKRRRAAREKRRRKALIEQGICVYCANEPLVTGTAGEKCRAKYIARSRAKQEATRIGPKRIQRCRLCGGLDHNAGSCEERASAEVSIEHYATARVPLVITVR